MSIQITRTEFAAAELRRKACQVSNPNQARRVLAIASILDGASRTHAAKSAGMERQTLRDWVHRYNAEGIEGLKDRPNPGRKPLLNEEQLSELDRIVETQLNPDTNAVVRWRCCDLKAEIKKRFDVEISERSVGRILRERGFRRLSVRPKHPKADEAHQANSARIFPPHYGTACPSTPRLSPSKSGFKMKPALARKAR
jgi:putative transposase